MKSLHNSSYWTKEPYLGLGPAAHSYNGYIRSWNSPSVTKYCRYYNSQEGVLPPLEYNGAVLPPEVGGYEELRGEDVFNESIMLGLRTIAGVDLSLLDNSLVKEILPEIRRHCRLGNLVMEGDKIKIPQGRLFVSDGIIRDLFV